MLWILLAILPAPIPPQIEAVYSSPALCIEHMHAAARITQVARWTCVEAPEPPPEPPQ